MHKLFISRGKNTGGFTIVELLVVIVVIGILAAITIVAYNGIQQRAQIATVQSDLEGAAKQLAMDQITLSAYPATVSAANNGAGLKASSGTTYQYTVNNTASPQTYCLTATNVTTRYFLSSDNNMPKAGGCPGHGIGGVAAVTNLALDPAATKFHTNEQGPGWWNNRWGSYGTYSLLSDQSGPVAGLTTAVRWTTTTAGSGHGFHLSGNVETGTPSDWSGMQSVTPGDTITISAYIRKSGIATTASIKARFATNSTTWTNSTAAGSSVNTVAGQWISVYFIVNVPAGASRMASMVTIGADAVGDTLDGTGLMATQSSSMYNYADPTTSSMWVWNGTPNASTSTGPAL